MRSPLLLLAFLLSLAPAFAAVRHSEAKELQSVAKAYGLPAAVSDAAATFVDTGDTAPLRKLLRSNDLPIAVGAAGLLFEAGEPFAPAVVARLKRGEGSQEAQVACLSFATDRATVQFLVERLAAEKEAKLRRMITMSLRVITGNDLTTGDEWSAWWRKQSRRYRPKSRSIDEVLSKLAMAQSANIRDTLQSTANKAPGKKGADALEKVADIFGSVTDLQEEGRKLRLSRPAIEGDASFARGDFAAAAAAYGRAIAKRRNDHRSAFLQACALLELGKLPEAQKIFARLHREDDRRKAAGFMAELCGKEIAEPGRLLDHAVSLRGAMAEPEDFMTWDDPILRVIVSQRFAMVPGPEFVNLEKVAERFATEQDPLTLLGLALCHPPQMHEQLLNVLVERFPDHPAIVSQHLRRRSSWRAAERRHSYLPAIRAWVAAEPDNALPRLLEIAVTVESSTQPPDQVPPLSEEILTSLEEALRLPRYETHATAAARAHLMALRSVECASAARSNISGSQSGISHLLSSLSLVANGAFLRHERGLLDRISELQAAIAGRDAAAARSSMDHALGLAFKKYSRSLQLKHLRLHRADDPRLPQLEAEDEAVAAEARNGGGRVKKTVSLEILPVPSLQHALLQQTYQFTEQ